MRGNSRPLNTDSESDLLRHQIANSDPKVIVSDTDIFDELTASDLKSVDLIVTIDSISPFVEKVAPFESCAADAPSVICLCRHPRSVCLNIYTSDQRTVEGK